MIVKFFASKNGGSVASIDYLLNKRIHSGEARILQGDENITRALINGMHQKHKSCVGCLSFEEKNIDENAKKEIMQSFENMLLTSAMRGRYNILWVEHTDKNRLELNFVIPKIDLESKKAFNPYFHIADLKRVEKWQDFNNLSYGFSNPKDPAKENTIQGSKKDIALFNDYKALDSFLHERVAKGLLESRKSIVELLRANGVEVTREGKDYISVKLPDSTKAKRFKGGIYDEQFKSIAKLSEISREHTERERAYNERDNTAELERIKQELDNLIQSKTRYYTARNERLSLQEYQSSKSKEQNPSYGVFMRNTNDDDFMRDCVVSVDKTLPNLTRESSNNTERRQIHKDERQRDYKTEQQELLQNQLKRENNDNIRSRIYRRNREIANRIRINTEQRSRAIKRERAIIEAFRSREFEITKTRKRVSSSISDTQAEFRTRARTHRTEITRIQEYHRERYERVRSFIKELGATISTKINELANTIKRTKMIESYTKIQQKKQNDKGVSR